MKEFARVKDEIMSRISQVEYISFDIFDTLIFRLNRYPSRIFDLTFMRNSKLFPEYFEARDWREVRGVAARDAINILKREVKIKEIYDQLPYYIQHKDEIMLNELLCEMDNTFVNNEIYELVRELHDKGKKIILTSDMYFDEVQICEILKSCHIDVTVFYRIFISCEYKCSKKSTTLYEKVCSELKVEPKSIVHIGDNFQADVINARKVGINAIYYPLISESTNRFPFIRWEQMLYGDICDNIHPIRLLAADSNYDGEEKFWYELGAMILGPIVCMSAEWVLDVAEQNEIKKIFPLMREGKFLAQTLENAAENREWKGDIELLYISRVALYPSLLKIIRDKDISYIMGTTRMNVGKVFELLNLCIEDTSFVDYKTVKIADLINYKSAEGKSIKKELEEFLTCENTKEKIRQSIDDEDCLLVSYMKQKGMNDEAYLTYDIGWRGNAQNALQRLASYANFKTHGMHLLMNSKRAVVLGRNHLDGCDIRSYTGGFGRNMHLINDLNVPVFEMFFMCDEGTTAGYTMNEGKVIPQLKNIEYAGEQLSKIFLVQDGIRAFQRKFYEIQKLTKQRLKVDSKDVLKLVVRLLQFPTGEEAKYIGNLYYDQNFGIDKQWQIINSDLLPVLKKEGIGGIKIRGLERDDEWYPGMLAMANPFVNFRQIMRQDKKALDYRLSFFVEKVYDKYDKFVLVGAGRNFEPTLRLLRMAGCKIESVIDNNRKLQGQRMFGYTIQSFEQLEYSGNVFLITTTKEEYQSELKKQLFQRFGSEIKIICLND